MKISTKALIIGLGAGKSTAGIVLMIYAALFVSCGGSSGGSADEETLLLYSRASASYAEGNFKECAAMLDAQNNFFPALVLRSKALYFSGKGDEAEALLRKVLRERPGSTEAALFLARILREAGKEDEARETAEQLLRDNPQDIRALRLASDLASRRGDTEEAAALIDRAVEAAAETALVFVDRAKLRWTNGNGSGAQEDLRRAELLLPWNTALNKGIHDLRTVIDSMEAN
jgi:tetratricopeptide (TPR) repeat protein